MFDWIDWFECEVEIGILFFFFFFFFKRWKELEMWSNGQDLLRDCDKESFWSTMTWIELNWIWSVWVVGIIQCKNLIRLVSLSLTHTPRFAWIVGKRIGDRFSACIICTREPANNSLKTVLGPSLKFIKFSFHWLHLFFIWNIWGQCRDSPGNAFRSLFFFFFRITSQILFIVPSNL